MDEDTSWYGSRPRPGPHCVRRGPSSPAKGAQQPPSFRPMSIFGHGRSSQLLLRSCHTAHCTASIYFTMVRPPTPLKIVPSHGGLDLPLRNSARTSVPKHHILCINVRPHDFTRPSSSIYSALSSYIRLPLASPEPVARCSVR